MKNLSIVNLGLLLSLTVVAISSCGGSSPGTESTDNNITPNTSLPQSDSIDGTNTGLPGTIDTGSTNSAQSIRSVYPFQPIAISYPAAAVDSIYKVKFHYKDTSGNTLSEVESAGVAIEPGGLMLIVPQGIDHARSELVFGDVELSIDGSLLSEKLMVSDLPVFSSSTAGSIYAATIQSALDDSKALTADLIELQSRGLVSVDDFDDLVEDEAYAQEQYSRVLNEFDSTGTITMENDDEEDASYTLSASDLDRIDRSIVMSLAYTKLYSDVSIERRAGGQIGYAAALTDEQREFLWSHYRDLERDLSAAPAQVRDAIVSLVRETERDIREKGLPGAQQFMAGITLSVWLRMQYLKVAAESGSALAAAQLAKLRLEVTSFIPTLILNRLTSSYTDSIFANDKDGYDYIAELMSNAVRIGLSTLNAFPEDRFPANGLSDLDSVVELKDAIENARTLVCTRENQGRPRTQQLRAGAAGFCDLPAADDGPLQESPTVEETDPDAGLAGYVVDRIEIPKTSYENGGSIVCNTQISETKRVYTCKDNQGRLDTSIVHNFKLRSASGNVFVPGEPVYIDVSATVSGYSFCCSIGNYISAHFQPSNKKFTVDSHTGIGNGFNVNNTDLPATGVATLFATERQGNESMSAVQVATMPDVGGGDLQIVLNGTNGDSMLTYHLRPVQ